jgi:hypothetical protein
MEGKTKRSIEFRYLVSLLAVVGLFMIANCWDYMKYSNQVAAYDVSVPFGLPFVMVVKGGAIVVRPEIVWNGVVANAIFLLWIAGVGAWLWHRIVSR